MFREMAKINKWLESIQDPVCSAPDRKLIVAQMAAAKLGMLRTIVTIPAPKTTEKTTLAEDTAKAAAMVAPRKGTIGKRGEQSLRIEGKVLQVTAEGILLEKGWKNMPVEQGKGAYVIEEVALFIIDASGKFVDGEPFSSVVYPAGTYVYTDVSGAKRTVHCYSVSALSAEKRRAAK